jgi:hypothetical protein|tara:strand:- start:141 stop:269 length:129 start_codon:yes stop_codon:yes gene_type:complete
MLAAWGLTLVAWSSRSLGLDAWRLKLVAIIQAPLIVEFFYKF